MTSLTLERRDGYLLTSSIATAHAAMPVALSKIMMDTDFLCGGAASIEVTDKEAGDMISALDAFLGRNSSFGAAVTELKDRISFEAGLVTKAMLIDLAANQDTDRNRAMVAA